MILTSQTSKTASIFFLLIFQFFCFPLLAQQQETGTWMTTPDRSKELSWEAGLSFKTQAAASPIIEINTAATYQTIDGFGFSLTGGSAGLINQKLNQQQRAELLQALFTRKSNGIGISYLRISIGASDLDDHVFSYDDLSDGATDYSLSKFSLEPDRKDLISIIKQILKLNPKIKIMGSPWSPPVWMKTNGVAKGGSLKADCYEVYARYLKKYVLEMKKEGITIDAITIQNEPENPNNTPSLVMTAPEQNEFIKKHLGPGFHLAGLKTKIILFDHNCDHPEYPISILNDAVTKKIVDGTAFHLYLGEIDALSTVYNAHPDKNIYFTEQWTSGKGDFGGDLRWHIKNVVIGATRNWSKVVLEWNLAADENFNPHTSDGGCTLCLGALTIGEPIKKNVSYFIIGHASSFVKPGSVRIFSNQTDQLPNVAFITPDHKKVLIVVNDSEVEKAFSIRYQNKIANSILPAGAVATYVWK